MHNYLIIKLSYTDQKKLLPNFLKFKLNKRGVSFFGEYSDDNQSPILVLKWAGLEWASHCNL